MQERVEPLGNLPVIFGTEHGDQFIEFGVGAGIVSSILLIWVRATDWPPTPFARKKTGKCTYICRAQTFSVSQVGLPMFITPLLVTEEVHVSPECCEYPYVGSEEYVAGVVVCYRHSAEADDRGN
jgi:hypothetical protein